jgi:hypothetical protein
MLPLVSPVACTVCAPGCVDFGTTKVCLKAPALSAVDEPAGDASKVRSTVSPEENPEPPAVIFVVGGLDVGAREIVPAKARMALAPRTTVSDRTNVRAVRVIGIPGSQSQAMREL